MNITSIQNELNKNKLVAIYFSTLSCHICEDLFPKIKNLILKKFDKTKLLRISFDIHPQICSHFSIFEAPVFLMFFDGKEFIRKSRFMSLTQLDEKIQRLYKLYFS